MKYKCHESCPPHKEDEEPKCRSKGCSGESGLIELVAFIAIILFIGWLIF